MPKTSSSVSGSRPKSTKPQPRPHLEDTNPHQQCIILAPRRTPLASQMGRSTCSMRLVIQGIIGDSTRKRADMANNDHGTVPPTRPILSKPQVSGIDSQDLITWPP